jgi:hypothetical protein
METGKFCLHILDSLNFSGCQKTFILVRQAGLDSKILLEELLKKMQMCNAYLDIYFHPSERAVTKITIQSV